MLATALEKSGNDRLGYLDRACAGRHGLREEVDSLLRQADSGLTEFLEESAALRPSEKELERDLGGKCAGPFRLLHRIGRGGMGQVYLARNQARVPRQVAIKIIRDDVDSPALRLRFETEQQLHERLNHRFVVQLIARTSVEHRPCMVLEHVPGPSIDVHCNRKRLDLFARIALFVKVCDAVQHVHDQAIIHCDIKASNILIAKDGTPRLLDFGIAEPAPSRAGPRPHASRPKRLHGIALFTPECAAPEQFLRGPATRATDIYALGLLLLRLLSDSEGVAPAWCRAKTHIRREHPDCADPRSSMPATDRRSLDSKLAEILSRALASDPADRYDHVDAFSDDLRMFVRDRRKRDARPG